MSLTREDSELFVDRGGHDMSRLERRNMRAGDKRDAEIMNVASRESVGAAPVALACWGLDEAEFSDILDEVTADRRAREKGQQLLSWVDEQIARDVASRADVVIDAMLMSDEVPDSLEAQDFEDELADEIAAERDDFDHENRYADKDPSPYDGDFSDFQDGYEG